MKKIKLVYIGREINSKGKIVYCYLRLDENGQLDKTTLNLYPKRIAMESVGGIIEGEEIENGIRGAKVVDKFNDKKRVGAWVATDRLKYSEWKSIKELKSPVQNTYQEGLALLEEVYYRIPVASRVSFLIKLCSDIRGKASKRL